MNTIQTNDQALLDLEAKWHELDREFQQATDEMLVTDASDESELGQRADALFEERCEIEREIARAPAHSTAGIAVKLRRYIYWVEQDDIGNPITNDEREIDDHLAISAARDAIRLATEEARS